MPVVSFNTEGFAEISAGLGKLQIMPTDDILSVLMPGGKELAGAQRLNVLATFRQHSGRLYTSIRALPKLRRESGGGWYVLVTPTGTHHQFMARIRQDIPKSMRRKKSPSSNAFNSEVGFVLEYGAPRRGLRKTNWMTNANRAAETRAIAASEAAFQAVLDRYGLTDK